MIIRHFTTHIIKSAVAIALAVTTAVTSAAVITPITAEASRYNQDDAYKFLRYVNDLRKDGHAWQRDENNNVIYIHNLSPIQWSDTLTSYAKERAMDIVPKDGFYEYDTSEYLPENINTEGRSLPDIFGLPGQYSRHGAIRMTTLTDFQGK